MDEVLPPPPEIAEIKAAHRHAKTRREADRIKLAGILVVTPALLVLRQRFAAKAAPRNSAFPLLGLAAGLALIAFFIVWRVETHALETRFQEKETLLKEVHYRVKNNLQVISSLLDLQEGASRDPALKATIREGRAMSLIHEMLYQRGEFARIPFGEYLERLARTLP
jgi:two-component sensor histidine kinase